MSTLPSTSAGSSWSRGSGTNQKDDFQVAGLAPLVQLVLHELAVLVGDAPLRSLVDEVERAVVRDADADEPALDHLIEVAREGLVELGAHGFGQRRLVRQRRQRLLACCLRSGRSTAADFGSSFLPEQPDTESDAHKSAKETRTIPT